MTIRISDFTIEATPIAQQLLDVKAYATENYDKHGWDFVIECYSDEELAEAIGKRKNSRGAINAMYAIVKAQDDARKEARAAGGEFADDEGEGAAIAKDDIADRRETEQEAMEKGEQIAAEAEAAALIEDKAAIDAAAAARRIKRSADRKRQRDAKKAAA